MNVDIRSKENLGIRIRLIWFSKNKYSYSWVALPGSSTFSAVGSSIYYIFCSSILQLLYHAQIKKNGNRIYLDNKKIFWKNML